MIIRKALARIGYYTKPDFIIIGVQKGGTSGLFSMLKTHSHIDASSTKEVHYFDKDKWYSENKIYQYHSFFPLPFEVRKNTKIFEASPIYIFHPKVASRLHTYNSNLKLILLLRDPVERAFSAWTMYHHHFKNGKYSHLHDPRSFSEAISDELKNIEQESFYDNRVSYVKRGIYHIQIKEYLKYFKKKQLLIIDSKNLRLSPDIQLNRIQQFIDVPTEKLNSISSNVGRVNDKVKYFKDLEKLRKFYEVHNDKLSELIGIRFNWNNK